MVIHKRTAISDPDCICIYRLERRFFCLDLLFYLGFFLKSGGGLGLYNFSACFDLYKIPSSTSSLVSTIDLIPRPAVFAFIAPSHPLNNTSNYDLLRRPEYDSARSLCLQHGTRRLRYDWREEAWRTTATTEINPHGILVILNFAFYTTRSCFGLSGAQQWLEFLTHMRLEFYLILVRQSLPIAIGHRN